MIAKHYINEAIRIRNVYLENIKEISKLEPKIENNKKRFFEIKDEMENIVKSDKNEIRKTVELNSRLILLEKEIKSIQDKIKPYYNNIENLRTDKDKLYLSIIEKYPGITEKQIEKEITPYIKE